MIFRWLRLSGQVARATPDRRLRRTVIFTCDHRHCRRRAQAVGDRTWRAHDGPRSDPFDGWALQHFPTHSPCSTITRADFAMDEHSHPRTIQTNSRGPRTPNDPYAHPYRSPKQTITPRWLEGTSRELGA